MIVKERFTKSAYFMTLRVGVVLPERNYISDVEQIIMLHFIKISPQHLIIRQINLLSMDKEFDDPKSL